jgi:hypothetical protein
MGHLEAFGFGFPSSQSSLSAISFRAFSRLCSRAPSFGDLVLSPRLMISWLGREDSNLRMVESKSGYFTNDFKAHSDKAMEFVLNETNGLAAGSELNPPSEIWTALSGRTLTRHERRWFTGKPRGESYRDLSR